MTEQRKHYSPEINQEILRLQQTGMRRQDIATTLNVPITKVHKTILIHGQLLTKEQRRHNVYLGRQKTATQYPAGTTEKILELQKAGVRRQDIAEQLNVSIDKVSSDIQRYSDYSLTSDQISAQQKKYPEELREKIVNLRKQGISLEEIVNKTQVSLSTVRWILADNGTTLTTEQRVDNNPLATKKEIVNRAIELRKTFAMLSEIAKQTGINKKTLKSILIRNETTIPSDQAQKNASLKKKENQPNRLMKKYGADNWQSIAEAEIRKKGGTTTDIYIDHTTKMKIACSKGHIFDMNFAAFKNSDQWCPSCANVGPSKPQLEVEAYVKTLVDDVVTGNRQVIKPMELDIWVPSKNLGIEYNGLYFHSNILSNNNGRHQRKFDLCFNKGINLLAFFSDEWEKKPDLIKAMIRWRLGKFVGTKYRASDLELRMLEKNSDWTEFFNRNHLDGSVRASYGFGLFDGPKLIQCLTLKKNFNKEWEIKRLATDYNYMVHGGATKLIQAAIKSLPEGEPLISFSNNRLSSGNMYKNCGFKLLQENAPSYWYTDGFNTRIWRFKCKRNNDPAILAKFPTEWEQARVGVFSMEHFGDERPLYRIEDYGHKKWILNPSIDTSTPSPL